jgi:hypothetical protein
LTSARAREMQFTSGLKVHPMTPLPNPRSRGGALFAVVMVLVAALPIALAFILGMMAGT